MSADPQRSVADYRALAARYDRATRLIDAARRRAIAALAPAPGATVLDVACGTGFSFAPLLERIGASGLLLAFDHSPELLAIARRRVELAGWRNVLIVEAAAEAVDFRGELARRAAAPPSALLFSYTHDILQSEAALANLLAQAAPGARVALCGTRLWPRAWWPLAAPVNAWLRRRHRRYLTNPENFDRPWAKIAPRLDEFEVRACWPGWRYLATGRLRAA
jgi:SAM-dependent methyltransferase